MADYYAVLKRTLSSLPENTGEARRGVYEKARAALVRQLEGFDPALMAGRINTSFEDVAEVAAPVLRHRIILEYEARIEGKTTEQIITSLLEEIPRQELDLPNTLKES